jgi:hypothetical protein
VRVGGFSTVVSHDFEAGPSGWNPGAPNDARGGRWEWGDPEASFALDTPAQSGSDHTRGGTYCWVTGAAAGGAAVENDVDFGRTTLYSPIFDLSGCLDPLVSYARWYTNNLAGNTDEDELLVEVSADGGRSWVTVERVGESNTRSRRAQYRIADFVPLGPSVRFRFVAADMAGPSLVEAALDDFEILDPTGREGVRPPAPVPAGTIHLSIRPNPFSKATEIRYDSPVAGNVRVTVHDASGRRVRTLHDGWQAEGSHRIPWDVRDDRRRIVASGIYTIRVETPAAVEARRTVVIR